MTPAVQTILEFSQRLKELYETACEDLAYGPRYGHEKFYRHASNTALIQAEIIRRMAEALDTLCAWHDGLEVASHFDSPGTAAMARAVIATCAQLITEAEAGK